MLYNSVEFVLFLPIVLLVYYFLSHRAQNLLLILASYFFYMWWDWRFGGLLLFTTLLNYISALAVSIKSPYKRVYLCINLTGNLAVLGFFKYYNFFVQSLATALSHIGLHPYLPVLHILLPIGISFYTFQMMGYIIDVYRGRIPATREFIPVAAFTCFFPLLMSGPIERAERMIPQFQKKRVVDNELFSSGLFLIFLGFFKKIAIADAVAQDVNSVFSHVATAPWPELIGALWFFTIQIYYDFSGYTDIARGVARLFGFNVVINFNHPFFISNIAEHWRRWHISLSNWFRDYIYISLGGNRKGAARTYYNILLTMVLAGLWHGANWTYVLWGTLHGIYLVVHRWFSGGGKIRAQQPVSTAMERIKFICGMLLTLHLIFLSWTFFRVQNLAETYEYIKGIVTLRGSIDGYLFYFVRLAFFLALVLLVEIPQYLRDDQTVMLKWPWALQGVAYGLMIILMILLAPDNELPFIYFKF